MKLKLISIIFLMPLLSACYHDDEGEKKQWPGDVDENNMPVVNGEYTLAVDDIFGRCNNGGEQFLNGYTIIVKVTQNRDKIRLPAVVNKTELHDVIQISDLTKNGDFVVMTDGLAPSSDYEGDVIVQQEIRGKFSPDSWRGEYSYRTIFKEYGVACDFYSTFSGRKIDISTLF